MQDELGMRGAGDQMAVQEPKQVERISKHTAAATSYRAAPGAALRLFRVRVLADGQEQAGELGATLRLPYMHVFANIAAGETRLTELAALAGVTRPAMAKLVDALETRGLVERRADPTDRRAKLVVLTPRGQDVIRIGRTVMSQVAYARRVRSRRYEAMCQTMQLLLGDLNGAPPHG